MAHRWGNIRFDDPNFKNGYNKREAYGQSKIACLMFAYEMNRRLQKAGYSTLSVAAHPGVAYTNLTQHMPKFVNLFAPLMGIVLNNATDGALPTLYAALGDDIHGGGEVVRHFSNQLRNFTPLMTSDIAHNLAAAFSSREARLEPTLIGAPRICCISFGPQ